MRSRGGITLIGVGFALGGYTLGWFGILMIRGYSGPGRSGPGLFDLLRPSRAQAISDAWNAGPPGANPNAGIAPGSVIRPGGQVGAANPPNNIVIGPGGQVGAQPGTAATGGTPAPWQSIISGAAG